MKTGEVRDPGTGSEPYLETNGWTPWLYHAPEDEIERYYSAANALMMRLERMPPAVRARLDRIEIRCPLKGCLLARVYWVPRRPTAEELEHHHRLGKVRYPDGRRVYGQECRVGNYLYVGRTADGTEVYDILSYGFSSTYKDEVRGCICCRIVYWRAGCRHGTASLERHAVHDMFSIARRVLGPMQTEEQAVAGLPDHLRKSWDRRVFRPAPSSVASQEAAAQWQSSGPPPTLGEIPREIGMKTVGVRESDDGEGLYLETDCWTPWQYYVPEEELEPYYRDANALMMKLERMPPAVRARLDRIEIRCPAKGCLLATVYWVLRRPTAKELEWDRHERPLRAAHDVPTDLQSHQRGYFLYVGRTAGGIEVYDILNYLHGGLCPNSCILYWRAGCRHGTASIDHAFIHDSFSLAGRWHHFREEDVVARLPEYARRFWGKRVFPPEPSAWRPKKRQSRPVSSSEVKKGAPALREGV